METNDFKYDKNSSRSKFNQFLDQCPEWVQEEVWGDNGLRAEIEEKQKKIDELIGDNAVLYNQVERALMTTVYERNLEKKNQELSSQIQQKQHDIDGLKYSVRELCGLIDEFVHMPVDSLLKRMTTGMEIHKERLHKLEQNSTQE